MKSAKRSGCGWAQRHSAVRAWLSLSRWQREPGPLLQAREQGCRARLLLATYRERRRTHFARPPNGRWGVGQSLVIVQGELWQ
jgi:hypothetical protein